MHYKLLIIAWQYFLAAPTLHNTHSCSTPVFLLLVHCHLPNLQMLEFLELHVFIPVLFFFKMFSFTTKALTVIYVLMIFLFIPRNQNNSMSTSTLSCVPKFFLLSLIAPPLKFNASQQKLCNSSTELYLFHLFHLSKWYHQQFICLRWKHGNHCLPDLLFHSPNPEYTYYSFTF